MSRCVADTDEYLFEEEREDQPRQYLEHARTCDVSLTEEEMNVIRWRDLSVIMLSAMNALDPTITLQEQMTEAIRCHENVSKDEAISRGERMFDIVGLERSRLNLYQHQMSGGMQQRCIIAMALVLNPKLIVADEPTSALDVVTQDHIFKYVEDIRRNSKTSLWLITHDVSVVAENCERMAVMYAGRIMEYASTYAIFKNPQHPYTQGLVKAFPSRKSKELQSIPGYPPELILPIKGCEFKPRCPYAMAKCGEEQALTEVENGHYVRCHLVSS